MKPPPPSSLPPEVWQWAGLIALGVGIYYAVSSAGKRVGDAVIDAAENVGTAAGEAAAPVLAPVLEFVTGETARRIGADLATAYQNAAFYGFAATGEEQSAINAVIRGEPLNRDARLTPRAQAFVDRRFPNAPYSRDEFQQFVAARAGQPFRLTPRLEQLLIAQLGADKVAALLPSPRP